MLIFIMCLIIGLFVIPYMNGEKSWNSWEKNYKKQEIVREKYKVENQKIEEIKSIRDEKQKIKQKEDEDFIIKRINYNIKMQHKIIRDDDTAGWAEWNYYNCKK